MRYASSLRGLVTFSTYLKYYKMLSFKTLYSNLFEPNKEKNVQWNLLLFIILKSF